MSKLTDLIRYENANSALAFRATPYAPDDHEALIVDLLALANARVTGSRVLVLGVEDEVGGVRRIQGVERKALEGLGAAYSKTAREYIRPSLRFSLNSLHVDDRVLAVIVLKDCDDKPYALGRDLSGSLCAGTTWIRRGSRQDRLDPPDLAKLFGKKFSTGRSEKAVTVGFEGTQMPTRVSLPALPLSRMPSELARERIEGQLESRKAAHERFGATDTWLDRLTFARLNGADKPYKTQTQVSLLIELGQTEKDNEAADRYYEYELRAHLVNLVIENSGDDTLNGASVVISIPVMDGIGVADRIYPPVGIEIGDVPKGYPKVDFGERQIQVVTKIDQLESGARQKLFRQPLRLMLREPAVGRNLPINYTVLAGELREPVSGSLTVAVNRADEHQMQVCVQS